MKRKGLQDSLRKNVFHTGAFNACCNRIGIQRNQLSLLQMFQKDRTGESVFFVCTTGTERLLIHPGDGLSLIHI